MHAPRARIGVLISGRGTNMAALLYASRANDCPFEIALVASNNPDAPGLALAAAEGVPTFAHSHKGMERAAFDAIIDAELRAAGCDYVVLAGYMRLLSPAFVEGWAGRMLNIHPSLLPKYKGLDTHQRAIDAGDSHGGCSVHIVTVALDDGPVLAQTPVAILPGDTADDLAARVLIAEHALYPHAVAAYVTRELQPEWIENRVREMALALPETAERPSFGSAGWRVGGEKSGKYFAYMSADHHGEKGLSLLVKTSGPDEQEQLLANDPDRYFRPAFYGTSGWIAIRLDRGPNDWSAVGDWLARSWAQVAPARLRRLQSIADEF